MSYDNLLVSTAAGIQTITINRPDKLNALNRGTIAELHAAFAAARDASDVRVVVLTGAGPKAFVAGADINELASSSPVECRDLSQRGQRMMRFVETLGKPVIAQINGFALGGGLEIALCCHLRIAADTAKLGLPEITLGVLPGFGGTQRLQRLTSRAAALELTLLGEAISAQRAYELGVVNRVVPTADLGATVDKIASRLAASAPHALRGILDAILHGGETPLDQGLEFETQVFGLVSSTADKAEGTRAFLEKRAAVFSGS